MRPSMYTPPLAAHSRCNTGQHHVTVVTIHFTVGISSDKHLTDPQTILTSLVRWQKGVTHRYLAAAVEGN